MCTLRFFTEPALSIAKGIHSAQNDIAVQNRHRFTHYRALGMKIPHHNDAESGDRIVNVRIEKLVYGGDGLGRVDGQVTGELDDALAPAAE